MKVAIVGSRNYKDLVKVEEYVNNLPLDTIIISGGAKGVDSVAETTAKKRKMVVDIYLPNWQKLGKIAGVIRNQAIVDNADKVVAFWDGKSKGTKSTIDMAKKAGKEIEIYVHE